MIYVIIVTKRAIRKLQMLLNYNYKVSGIIKKVSYTITTFLKSKLKHQTTENYVNKLLDKFLEAH